MADDYGLGAMTGIIPTVMMAGVATNLINKVGLGAQQPPTAMAKTDTCRKCGNTIPADAKFCTVCGASTRTGRVLNPKYSKPVAKRAPIKGTSQDLNRAIFGGGQGYNPFK